MADRNTSKPASAGMQIDSKLVRELAELLSETGLSEIEVEDGDRKIRVARTLHAAPVAAAMSVAPAAPPPPRRDHSHQPHIETMLSHFRLIVLFLTHG